MLLWGGISFGASLSSGANYDVADGVWQGMNCLAAPPTMRSATGIWSGDVLIIWGAAALSSRPGTGGLRTP